MKPYLDYLRNVLEEGVFHDDRTGTGTIRVFGRSVRYNLQGWHVPVLTTKRIHLKSVIHELLWFLKGGTNVDYLKANGVSIWDAWVKEGTATYSEEETPKLVSGELGPIYGKQWRNWETKDGAHVDQIANLIEGLKNDPYGRRHIVSAWNVGELDAMALPPCHLLFQFFVEQRPTEDILEDLRFATGEEVKGNVMALVEQYNVPTKYLSCQLYQRSADSFLGVPFNIASYSLLTHMVAQQVGMLAKEFIWTGGDCHIYSNHVDSVRELLTREPKEPTRLHLTAAKDIFSYTESSFSVYNTYDGKYDSHPTIKASVAV